MMSRPTKEDLENYILKLKKSSLYQDFECRKVIEQVSAKIYRITAEKNVRLDLDLIDPEIASLMFQVQVAIKKANSKRKLLSKEPAPEVKEISEILENDYQRSIETLKFYKLIKEDPDDPGKYFYQADYKVVQGKKFKLPDLKEILQNLSGEQVILWRTMKDSGLEPKLQLTPVGYSVRTLAKKIDAHKKELGNKKNVVVWGKINDEEFVYDVEDFQASKDGKLLYLTGGKTKSELIDNTGGWQIEIVAMKSELSPDRDKIGNSDGVEFTSAQKMERYVREYRAKGYHGLSLESYLVAQMEAYRRGAVLDLKTWTILPESHLVYPDLVNIGYATKDGIVLMVMEVENRDDNLRFRRAVRVGPLRGNYKS